MLDAGMMAVRRTETADFLRRAEAALEAAKAAGEPAWKVEALEEAVTDARDALTDHDRLGV